MKKIKNFIFPVVIALIGTGAALATNTANDAENLLETGYYYSSSATMIKCISTPMTCEVSGGVVCTWKDPATNITHNLLRKVNDTSCGLTLYRGF